MKTVEELKKSAKLGKIKRDKRIKEGSILIAEYATEALEIMFDSGAGEDYILTLQIGNLMNTIPDLNGLVSFPDKDLIEMSKLASDLLRKNGFYSNVAIRDSQDEINNYISVSLTK